MPRTKTTTEAPADKARTRKGAADTPAKGRRTRNTAAPAAPEAPDAAAVAAAALEAAARAERTQAVDQALVEVANWIDIVRTADVNGDGEAVRVSVEGLIAAARGASRAYGRRGAAKPPRARSSKNPAECRWHAVHPDGEVVACSDYRASTARDISVGKKHVRDLGAEATERDRRLAGCSLVENRDAPDVAAS